MSKKEFIIIFLLGAAFLGLLVLVGTSVDPGENIRDTEDSYTKLPNGERVYRHETEDSICFYTKRRALSCQGK